jgi:hypothetical protein
MSRTWGLLGQSVVRVRAWWRHLGRRTGDAENVFDKHSHMKGNVTEDWMHIAGIVERFTDIRSVRLRVD